MIVVFYSIHSYVCFLMSLGLLRLWPILGVISRGLLYFTSAAKPWCAMWVVLAVRGKYVFNAHDNYNKITQR